MPCPMLTLSELYVAGICYINIAWPHCLCDTSMWEFVHFTMGHRSKTDRNRLSKTYLSSLCPDDKSMAPVAVLRQLTA